MNQLHKDKRKFTYFENTQVFDTLTQIADHETARQGRTVTIPELIREKTLPLANRYLCERGQQEIEYDTHAGKFAPSSANSATLCTIDSKGNLDVRNKRGKKMDKWKKVTQVPQLLSSYPKCKIEYRDQLRQLADYL